MKITFYPADRVYRITHDDGRHELVDIDSLRRADPTLLKSLEESVWKSVSERIRSPETAWKPDAGTMTAAKPETAGAKSSVTVEDIDRMLAERHGEVSIKYDAYEKGRQTVTTSKSIDYIVYDEASNIYGKNPHKYEPITFTQITPTPDKPTPEPTPDTYGHW